MDMVTPIKMIFKNLFKIKASFAVAALSNAKKQGGMTVQSCRPAAIKLLTMIASVAFSFVSAYQASVPETGTSLATPATVTVALWMILRGHFSAHLPQPVHLE